MITYPMTNVNVLNLCANGVVQPNLAILVLIAMVWLIVYAELIILIHWQMFSNSKGKSVVMNILVNLAGLVKYTLSNSL